MKKLRWAVKLSLGLVAALMLLSCGNNELSWTEDVKLPDGRVITLERWVEFKGGSSHFGDPSTESRQSFEFKHPDTGGVVRWRSDMEQGLLKTVAIWIENGNPLLITRPAYGGDSHKYHCPNPPYLLYEYVANNWHFKPLSQISIKQIRSNLTMHPLEMRDEIIKSQRHLTADKTSDSYAYVQGVYKTPYFIRFDGMPVQTFVDQNCYLGPDINELTFIGGV